MEVMTSWTRMLFKVLHTLFHDCKKLLYVFLSHISIPRLGLYKACGGPHVGSEFCTKAFCRKTSFLSGNKGAEVVGISVSKKKDKIIKITKN
jgi:hypothetical protein